MTCKQTHVALFILNKTQYFLLHWLPLAKATLQAGFEVHIAAPSDPEAQAKIVAEGFRFHSISISRRGLNPIREIQCFFEILHLFRCLRPDLVQLLTIKPVLYGGIAARLSGVPGVVATITGMGYVYIDTAIKARLLRWLTQVLYCLSLRGRTRVIFLNPDDRAAFLRMGVVQEKQVALISLPGVDMQKFTPTQELEEVPLIILPSRMLWDKGISEFVAAARRLRGEGVAARFALVGPVDEGNPAAIPEDTLRNWHAEGVVEWWGMRRDMPTVLAQSHIVCLPSYREGVPMALIEAAACSRPIVTTDAPGCREIVRDGINGFLVPVREVEPLVVALQRLIEDKALRQKMGQRGREIAMAEFAVERVVDETLKVYWELLG